MSKSLPNFGLLFLRLGLGICLIMHGIAKMSHGVEGIGAMIAAKGLPSFIAYGAYLGEVVAPLMLIFGVFTRIGAFLVLGASLFIIYVAHLPLTLTKMGGFGAEILFLYIAMSLCLLFTGSGKFAIIKD